MESKIMLVFYGNDCLPYKDKERQVHYPIVGSAFLGASNTTKISFYFDRIGNSNTTWVAVAKLPNGKQGSKVLSVSVDSELGENYAELSLDNWFTQAKGDVYIALQGYQGGVEYSYDSDTELYEIHGTPTIQTTGSIKLAINYAPIGDSPDYTDEFTTYQEILAALGDKANADSVYTKTETDTALNGKVDKLSTTGTYAYTHNGSTQGEVAYTSNTVGNAIVQRDANGQIKTPTVPNASADAINKGYFEIQLASGLSTKQNTLVSGTNIKSLTVDGVEKSLLGSGTIEVGASSGGGAWGEITGDIQDQTDLQNEFQNVREIAEGKCATYILSYSRTAPTTDAQAQALKKPDGTAFTNLSDFNTYVSGLTLKNSSFNSQNNSIIINYAYLIFADNVVYKLGDLIADLKKGDIFLIGETDVPDRWVSGFSSSSAEYIYVELYKLETSKIDLTSYATTGDLTMARYETELLIAPEYNQLTSYAVGDKVVRSHKLYTCNTPITTPETWDSTHWTQVSVASGFVDLDKSQVISGVKTFSNGIKTNSIQGQSGTTNISFSKTIRPEVNNDSDLGLSNRAWKDLYLSGSANIAEIRAISGTTVGVRCDLRSAGSPHDIGNSTYPFKDLYLSGTINFGNGATITKDSNDRVNLNYNNSTKVKIGNVETTFVNRIGADVDNTYDVGRSATKFRDGYFAGQVYAQNTFNVINASDISSNTLTADQLAIFQNGKPTIVSGTFLNMINPVFFAPRTSIAGVLSRGLYVGHASAGNQQIGTYQITEGTGVISLSNATQDNIDYNNVGKINGKQLPNYPANANWKGEWYGTQVEYDALGTYDSNTTYYILES